MGQIARLIYGSDTLDLDDNTYTLMPDFRPPAPARAVNLASGTFRNKRGGRRAGSQPKDRRWGFSVRCLGASAAETHGAIHRLQWFLDRCADTADTLYLEYSPSDAVSYNPLWGQQIYRYEIKDASVDPWDAYGVFTTHDEGIVAYVSLLIGPHANGLKQRVASALGGVIEDTLGMVDGSSRGLNVPEGTTNKYTNPILGNATFGNTWTK